MRPTVSGNLLSQRDFDNLIRTLRLTISLGVVGCRDENSSQDLKKGCSKFPQKDFPMATIGNDLLWNAPAMIITLEEYIH